MTNELSFTIIIILCLGNFYPIFSQDTIINPTFDFFEATKGAGNRVYSQQDGSYLILGTLNNSGTQGGNTLTKFSENDTIMWQKVYDTFSANASYSATFDNSMNIYTLISDSEILSTGGIKQTSIIGAYSQDGTVLWEKSIVDSSNNQQLITHIKGKGNKIYFTSLNKSPSATFNHDIVSFGILDTTGLVEKIEHFIRPNTSFSGSGGLFLLEDSIVFRNNFSDVGNLTNEFISSFILDYNLNVTNAQLYGDSSISTIIYFDSLGNGYSYKRELMDYVLYKVNPELYLDSILSISPSTGNFIYSLHCVVGKNRPNYIAWTEKNSTNISIDYIARLDSLGNRLWEKQIPVLNKNTPRIFEKALLFEDGLVGFLHCYTDSTPTLGEPYIFQITPDGNKFFSWKVDLEDSKNWTKDIAIDPANKIIITGQSSRFSPNPSGMFVAKINPPLYVKDTSSSYKLIAKKRIDLTLSPNPITDFTYLSCEGINFKGEQGLLRIIDLNGKILKSSPVQLSSGKTSILINKLSEFSSGSYWFCLEGETWSAAIQGIIK